MLARFISILILLYMFSSEVDSLPTSKKFIQVPIGPILTACC